MAAIGSDLLDRFEVTTKVGYFPDGHSLDPARLRAAVESTIDDLGRAPDVVLLHNAERDPDALPAAVDALRALQAQGLFLRWGISTWDARPLLPVIASLRGEAEVLMTRAGITVPAAVLNAAERLAQACPGAQLRGMAPFAGQPEDPDWSGFDAGPLLAAGQSFTPIQARLAAAFALPEVMCIAVGTGNAAHLGELVEAAKLDTDPVAVARYRRLLDQAASVAVAPSTRSTAT